MRVRVVPHDPSWEGAFAEEAARIRRALGPIVLEVHHIGSTAIPGASAKPIIDICLEVTSPAALDERDDLLVPLGYEALGEFGIPGRRYLRRHDGEGIRTHQIHAFGAGSTEIERHLAFRDYMIAHPSAAAAYSRLKSELAERHPSDIDAYVDGKDSFVKTHERRALQWYRRRDES